MNGENISRQAAPEKQAAPENQAALPAPEKKICRARITYRRGEALRYTSHLDMQMVWERTLRRAGLPLAHSQGFSPRPRLHIACALPLGFLSRCELADIWLEDTAGIARFDPVDLAARIRASTPPGLEVEEVRLISLHLPALQTLVLSAEYTATSLDPLDADALASAVNQLLESDSLPRERRGKPYDLRPLVEGLEVRKEPEGALWMRLAARQGATGRPEELLEALGFDPAAFRVERTRLILADQE